MALSVKAPFTLLEKPVKTIWFDAIKAAQVAFGLVPKILNAIDVIVLIGKQFRVVYAKMVKVAYVESVVGLKSVCINDTIRQDFSFNDGHDRLSFSVRDNGGINLSAPLQKPKDSNFATSTPSAFALADTTKIAFICLHLTREFIAGKLACNELTQTHVKRDSGIGLNTDDLGGGPCCGPGNKMFNQPHLFVSAQSTFTFIHFSSFSRFLIA